MARGEGKTRTKRQYVTAQTAKVEDRRTRAMDLYLAGKTQMEIARELEYSQKQVSRDIQAIREEWRTERVLQIADHQEQELRRIDRIERAAWSGWERSLEERRVRQLEETTGRATKRGPRAVPETRKKLRQEEQAGDPRFLQIIASCVDQRCRILGLNAPKVRKNFNTDSERATRLAQLLGMQPDHLPN